MINALLETLSRLTLSVKSGRSWHRYRQQIVLYIFCRERTTMAKIAGHQQSRLPRFSDPYQSAIGYLAKLGKTWDHGPQYKARPGLALLKPTYPRLYCNGSCFARWRAR